LSFLKNILSEDGKEIAINWEDEIIKGTCLIHGGEVIHPQFV
jgi:NAD(P) transhydrogenase subunit alpha